MLELPPEFDANSYRSRYPDLATLTRLQLRQQWRQEGRRNCRNASPVETRQRLLVCLRGADHLLEIGPFDNPSLEAVRRPDQQIDYADQFSREEMIARAEKIPGRNPDNIPAIRYVLSQGGYGQITQRYDAVVSHHCLEHQPDLILHLQQVAQLLRPGGVYLCTVPDHRRCFDRYLPPTTLIDLVTANLERRTRPPLHAVVEHRCFTVQNWYQASDPTRELKPQLSQQLQDALNEYLSQPYVDVHCWKFTNENFRRLLRQLVILKYIPEGSSWKTYNLGDEFAAIISFKALHDPESIKPETDSEQNP